MKHPEIREGDMNLWLVVFVFVIALGIGEGDATGLFSGKLRLCMGNGRMGLNREHFSGVEDLQEIRKRILKTGGNGGPENAIRRSADQLRQWNRAIRRIDK